MTTAALSALLATAASAPAAAHAQMAVADHRQQPRVAEVVDQVLRAAVRRRRVVVVATTSGVLALWGSVNGPL